MIKQKLKVSPRTTTVYDYIELGGLSLKEVKDKIDNLILEKGEDFVLYDGMLEWKYDYTETYEKAEKRTLLEIDQLRSKIFNLEIAIGKYYE